MSRNTLKCLIFLVGVFVFISIACTIKDVNAKINQLNPWKDETIKGKKICYENIILSEGYQGHCSEGEPPIENNFAGTLVNIGSGYIHNVFFQIEFDCSGEYFHCGIQVDLIEPGQSEPIFCQSTLAECCKFKRVKNADTCEILTYPEHLDRITENVQDTEGQDIIHGAEGDDEIFGGDDDHDSTGEETIDISGLLDSFSGTWQASCPSLLPEYNCMQGDDTCTETNVRTFNLDFNTMTFSYENQWSYYDKGDEWEGTYEDCHGSYNSQGKIYKDGWMMGIENSKSHCDYVAWFFGILQDGERDLQRTNTLIATLQLEPQPAVVFTRYTPSEDLDISGYDQVPGAYKTLINDLSTVCPLTPTD